jgi:UDP-3-O-[3-hydroxymyristoyl] glucosamine N-acyltransferase
VAVTVRELAAWVGGEVVGDGGLTVQAARTLKEAQTGDITFVEDEKHLPHLAASLAAVAVVGTGTEAPPGKTLVRVPDPLMAFAVLVEKLHGLPPPAETGIDPAARVHPTAVIGPGATVGPFACVGEGTVLGARCRLHAGVMVGRFCKLGDDVTIYPNAVLYDATVLGHRVIIHANAVLGADGFGYRLHAGKHVKVPQLGSVEVGDDVEIGAGTTIDRGTFQATRIGAGTKIDNLIQIGHNCRIGRHNLLISQMGMAGSSSTGDYVVIAGQAGVVGHVHIGDRTVIGGQAAVTKDVPAGQQYLGSPATPAREQKRILMTMEKLPELRRDIRRILAHLGLDSDDEGSGKIAG